MKHLILADIHANRAALRAILDTPEARDCGSVVTLGDQINYGPCPAQCMALLRRFCAEGGRTLSLLRGNHEDRLPRLAELTGANWGLLRWSADRLAEAGEDMGGLPVDLLLADGRVRCTHGTPGDPWHLVDVDGARAELDRLAETEPACVLLLSGHNHIRWRVRSGPREAVNPGSAGMWEDERGCRAPFAVLTEYGGRLAVSLHEAPYAGEDLLRDYAQSGCRRAGPTIARLSLTVMRTGSRHLMMHYLAHARRVAEAMGGAIGDPAVWRAADAAWPWADGLTTEAFWTELEARYA